jgi:hypothetical protein
MRFDRPDHLAGIGVRAFSSVYRYPTVRSDIETMRLIAAQICFFAQLPAQPDLSKR